MRSLVVCIFSGVLAAAVVATAEAQESVSAPITRFPASDQVVELLASRLALSADQKAAIAPIIEERQAQFKALLADASAARRTRLREAQAILKASDARISVVLTPQQQTAYAALEQEMRQRLRQRAQGE